MPYRIVEHIGDGGQGSVYIAEGAAGKVALKEVESERDSMFEVDRLKQVPPHRNLVKFLDVVKTEQIDDRAGVRQTVQETRAEDGEPMGGGTFIVMSYLDGPPLAEYHGYKDLSPVACWVLMSQVFDGIQHMHRHQVIHRDLKPENIIITNDSGKPLPVVVDVGLAKRLQSARTVVHGGTPKYMPPEYIQSANRAHYAPSYDIFQLALIAFEGMHGDDLWNEDDGPWGQWDIEEAQRMLKEINPSPFSAALARGLERNPLLRPETVWEWVTDMVGLHQEPEPTPPPEPPIPPSPPDRAGQGFKASIAKVSVKTLRAEIEKEFNLPEGSVAILRPKSKEVAGGGMHLGTLAKELWPNEWDYGTATLGFLAREIAPRFGLKEHCIAFRKPQGGEQYSKVSHVNTLRKDYTSKRRSKRVDEDDQDDGPPWV